jgi:hypothetical protein
MSAIRFINSRSALLPATLSSFHRRWLVTSAQPQRHVPTPTMKFLKLLLLAAVALALTGCTGVYVSRPIGDRPHVLAPADWEGTWVAGDSTSRARIVDAAQGKLELIEAKFTDGKPKLEVTEIVISEGGDWLFATIINRENPDHNEWARIKLKDDQLIAWLPSREGFRSLVQSGKLHGMLDDKNILLAPLTAAEIAALTAGTLGIPFVWDEPLVLRRLPH